MSLAPPTEAFGGVKVYNLSSVGKALPTWAFSKKKKDSAANNKKKRRRAADAADERLEVIQDLYFPTTCGRVKVSRDGGTLMATGGYPPQVRAFELRELSLKFSRHFETEVVQFQLLSPDWKKAVFLLADRSVEFHSQFGKHHVTRIPHHGRCLGYQRETCELLLGGVGEDVYRLSLERGSFLSPFKTGASGVNALAVHPGHGMMVAGTSDGLVQCWDPRQRMPLGSTFPFDSPAIARALVDEGSGTDGTAELDGVGAALASTARASGGANAREITALRFDPRGLQLAVGTSTGHVALYDIRRGQPLLVKDHQYGLPIVDIKYHDMSGHVVSADAKSIKLWDKDKGKAYTTIQPPADVNDVCLFPGSGMIFAALETERLGAYFLPTLGPAPRWCHFLDALTEEMEEAPAQQSVYDDYKFVTREDLEKLNLGALIGTNTLRPYMHGFFIDARLHQKAVSLSQPFAYEQWRKERLQQKIAAKTEGRIAPVARPKPKVNADLADDLKATERAGSKKKGGKDAAEKAAAAGGLLDDDRFAGLFSNPDFQIDKESAEFQSLHPHAKEMQAAREARKKAKDSDDDDDDDDDDDEMEEDEDVDEDGSDDDDDDDDDDESMGGDGDGSGDEDELEQMMASKRRRAAELKKSRAADRGSKAAAKGEKPQRDVRMIGLQQDVLKGAQGASASTSSAAVTALPANASFGARLAALGSSVGMTIGAVGGGARGGSREMSFSMSAPSSASALPKGGRGGKGSMGRGGGKGGRGGGGTDSGAGGVLRDGRIDADGSGKATRDRSDGRRSLFRGMLSPGKGGGKGKGRGRGGGGRGRGR